MRALVPDAAAGQAPTEEEVQAQPRPSSLDGDAHLVPVHQGQGRAGIP